MYIKIKENAGSEYSSKPWDKTIVTLRGQWVEVDTTYLFNNQYNLKNYDLRVMDESVEAVRDDARPGKVKCGYCGKMFSSMEDLTAHYLEEEANAHNCENCRCYQKYIAHTDRSQTEHIDENGNQVVTTTTIYTWGKKCSRNACDKFEHRNHKPFVFTPENTYFMKYPNGYGAWFDSLELSEKWKEAGFTWDSSLNVATVEKAAGSYDISIHYIENRIDYATIRNSRNCYTITGDDVLRILNNHYTIEYLLKFDENGDRRAKYCMEGFPKSAFKEFVWFWENLRDQCRRPHKRHLYLGADA